jgi:hypothetical protein
MNRLLLILFFTIPGSQCAGWADEPDVIRAKLNAARDEFAKEATRLQNVLLDAMDKAEEKARTAGNKAMVDAIKAERKTFDETGKAPGGPNGTVYDKGMQAARTKIQNAYKHVETELLKAKKDAEVDAVEAELKEILASKPAMAKVPYDPYFVGTIWAGECKWNGDPGNHNYMIIITERSGTSFKGIARLDYAPSGDAKRKALYDIAGEVNGLNLKYKGDLEGLNEVEAKWTKDGLQISASASNGGTLSGTIRQKK